MKRVELDRLSTDDLWSLHIEVSRLLQLRIQSEKERLETTCISIWSRSDDVPVFLIRSRAASGSRWASWPTIDCIALLRRGPAGSSSAVSMARSTSSAAEADASWASRLLRSGPGDIPRT